jgi:UDP-N-acetylglucosamine--N-acetylmuramyl-(pentapeptide) pyrophosphoryl-undecaprenol N-acetylglucosamine transferase
MEFSLEEQKHGRLYLKKILLTGGGTAGHVTPNIALIHQLRELDFEIHYAGTHKGIEFELIGKENVPFHPLRAGKLRRYIDFKNLTDIFKIASGFIQAFMLIIKIHPHIIFSKGGFVSCPVVWAGWLLRKPVVIHESDMTPGLANKLSLPFAYKICYSFPETKKHVSQSKGILTGIPIRQTLFSGNPETGKFICGFTDSKPVLLIIGGSQGSQIINTTIRESLDTLLKEYNICHLCGKGNSIQNRTGYIQFEYVNEELAHLYALSDIVISRSGATTLFELLALRKPNLLIPLALNASRGDQILNARSFEKQGFSKVLLQENLTSETLITALNMTFNSKDTLISAMKKSDLANSADAVVNVIESVLKKRE